MPLNPSDSPKSLFFLTIKTGFPFQPFSFLFRVLLLWPSAPQFFANYFRQRRLSFNLNLPTQALPSIYF